MAMQNNGPSGYNLVQMQLFMHSIATQMAALNGLLLVAQTCEDDWERTCLVNAAQALAQGVGCLADHATGGQIIGGMGLWHIGLTFEKAGGAA